MKLYQIFKINKNGTVIKTMETHAQTIFLAWRGSVGWLSNGRYLIAAADGSAADVRTINR